MNHDDRLTGVLVAFLAGLLAWAVLTDPVEPVPMTSTPEPITQTAPARPLPPLAAEILVMELGQTWEIGRTQIAAEHFACWPELWPADAAAEPAAETAMEVGARLPCRLDPVPRPGPTFQELTAAIDDERDEIDGLRSAAGIAP